MTLSETKAITLEAFKRLPETEPASEFIEGHIFRKPMPKGRHSRLQSKLCAAINAMVEAEKIAYAFPELRCSFGNRSIVADIAILQWQNIPFLPDGQVPDNFETAPDWSIEILSPGQNPNRVIGNLLYCLEYRTQLGWLVDPDDQSVLTFFPNQQPSIKYRTDPLPVLEGIDLKLTVDQIFSWLRMNG